MPYPKGSFLLGVTSLAITLPAKLITAIHIILMGAPAAQAPSGADGLIDRRVPNVMTSPQDVGCV
jgi:hypothetical protein